MAPVPFAPVQKANATMEVAKPEHTKIAHVHGNRKVMPRAASAPTSRPPPIMTTA